MQAEVETPMRIAIDLRHETVFYSATTHYRDPWTFVPDYIDVHVRSTGGPGRAGLSIDTRYDQPDLYHLFP
jgi:hypothetical protein